MTCKTASALAAPSSISLSLEDRVKAKDTTFRPRDGVNACPTTEEMYDNQSPEVGSVHLPIYRPTGLFKLNAVRDRSREELLRYHAK